MKPPRSFPGKLLAGAALVGAGAAGGAYAGWQTQAKNGGLAQGTGAALGGALGGLLASFAGLLLANTESPWGGVGDAAALVGFGGMTVMATATAFGPGGVFGGAQTLLPAGSTGTPTLNPTSPTSGPASGPAVTGGVVETPSGGGGSF